MSKNLYLQIMSWRENNKLVQNYVILRWMLPSDDGDDNTEVLDFLHLALNELKEGLRGKLR